MEAVKVPQHLELDDVIAFSLGATDLLCLIVGGVVAWWLYLVLPGAPVFRIGLGAFPALTGLALGVLRIGDLGLRDWLAIGLAYALQPRVLVTGVTS